MLRPHPNEPVGCRWARNQKPRFFQPARFGANRRGYPPDKSLARKAIPTDIRSLCRTYPEESIRHLAAIMRQPEYPPAVRVQAAVALLDRGWGRPAQPHVGEADRDIRVVIRRITDVRKD